MTDVHPSSQQPPDPQAGAGSAVDSPPQPSPAMERAGRLTAANMLRSLLPLVVICLVIVAWQNFRSGPDEQIHTVDPSTTVQLAAARAGYHVQAPNGLAAGYRPTSARTDAGNAGKGDRVTLEIGYLTPAGEFAGFTESDDPRGDAIRAILDGARQRGTADIGGTTWTRSTTQRGETAFSRVVDGVTIVVTGSAKDAELTAVAASVKPYSG